MPVYDYVCASCGDFDALRSIAARNEPVACPHCTQPSPRTFAVAPHLACMDSNTREAMSVNERSAHEPRSSREGTYARWRHPAGCGCCTPGARRTKTLVSSDGAKSFPTKRPWMISH
ncbi:MAG: FmdB family zinc ribbon protein [Casimicrobium sp.]